MERITEKKVENQEKSTIPQMSATNFIITDPSLMPYYCDLCQISRRCQNYLEDDNASTRHKYRYRGMSNCHAFWD